MSIISPRLARFVKNLNINIAESTHIAHGDETWDTAFHPGVCDTFNYK